MKAIFLDRDGILNEERGDYTFRIEDFVLLDGIVDVLNHYKNNGFMLLVVTNQAGIARGKYTRGQMHACHAYFQQQSGGLIEAFYYAPGHPDYSESLSRKPGTLLFERAIAKYGIDPAQSWMIGDKERDLVPAKKLGMQTVLLADFTSNWADFHVHDIREVLSVIPV